MNCKIGLITSNRLLIKQIKKIISSFFPDIELMVEDISRKEIGSIIHKFGRWGSEAILCSHSFTFEKIHSISDMPVIFIPKQPLDILESMVKASVHAKPIGLSSYIKPPLQIEFIEKIIDTEVKPIVFRNQEELKHNLIAAFEDGIEVVVGGVFTQEISKQYKKKSVLIQYGEDGLYDILKYTNMIIETAREHEEKNKLVNTIIEYDNKGVIVTDKSGKIIFINQYIEAILDLPAGMSINQPVRSILPDFKIASVLQKKSSDILNSPAFKDVPLIINSVPLQVAGDTKGVLIYLRKLKDLQEEEIKTRRKVSSQSLETKYAIDNFTTQSPTMKELIRRIKSFAAYGSTILITGESGSGKEIVAHSLHHLSRRRRQPFVAVNCSTLQENLLDSELFGYDEGAFTGAKKGGKSGLFELAHKGSIFLDEIGTLPVSLQAKLLRVLQEKEIRRIGGEKNIPIDVRCIAATNANLNERIQSGRFRSDLFYRLSVLNLHVPPLRQRIEDISPLIEILTDQFCREYRIKKMAVMPGIVERLKLYSWPGNVRELENYLRKYVILSNTHKNKKNFEWLMIRELKGDKQPLDIPETPSRLLVDSKNRSERIILEGALKKSKGNKGQAAALLGISRSTLWRKMRKNEL